MAVMLGNLHGALREAGVSEERAQRAAEEASTVSGVTDLARDVAQMKIDGADLKRDVSLLKIDAAQIKTDVAQLKTDNAVVKWMLGFVLALVVAILGLLLRGLR